MQRRVGAAAVLFFCLFSLILAGGKPVVSAEGIQGKTFTGEVELLRQDRESYVMQVTVENKGEDFSGTVQVIFGGSGFGNCAYNTQMDLPAQGKKQFTLTIPERAAETVQGLCAVNFLDKKGRTLQSVSLKNVFGNTRSGIPVGILSDQDSLLTYMDAGGMDFAAGGMQAPLNLIELDPDGLKENLQGLNFLVIDQFNVSSLDGESIRAIQDWVEEGGCMIVGTGAYAEETLSGFEEDFLGVGAANISEPGEESIVSVNADRYGYYYNYAGVGIDFTRMSVADLNYNKGNGYFYESSENPALLGSVGEGAVAVYYVSLGETELQKLDDYRVQYMYEELLYQSGSYMSYNGYSDMDYAGQRALASIDGRNTRVDFTWLKILIGIYVVLVGPVLYLVLRKCRKSEWYWGCVPVLGILFIGGVYLFGQGARVTETRVYSVTAQRADSTQEDTYFLAYHSGIKPWEVRLNDGYEIAGPGWESSYYGSYGTIDDYFYMVGIDSEGLSVGIKPQENFESGFLYAGGKTESKGRLLGTDLCGSEINGSIGGTVMNETDRDLEYMAVWLNSYIMVFSDVKAGETLDLQQAARDGRCVYQSVANYYNDFMYDMLSFDRYRSKPAYNQDEMAALFIGLGIAGDAKPMDKNYAVLVGVVKDYEKAVVSKCSEISYGCLYSYAETEAE